MEYGKITLKMGIRMNIVYYTYWYMEKKIKKKWVGYNQSIFTLGQKFLDRLKHFSSSSSLFFFFFFCSNLLYLFIYLNLIVKNGGLNSKFYYRKYQKMLTS